MYWANITPSLPQLQAQVLKSLGLAIQQDLATGTRHGDWLQYTMEHLPEDESILFLDVDAFPLSRDIVERAFRAAEQGGIFGVAQTANHLDPTFIYAGPMFLCMSKRTWNALGSGPIKLLARLAIYDSRLLKGRRDESEPFLADAGAVSPH